MRSCRIAVTLGLREIDGCRYGRVADLDKVLIDMERMPVDRLASMLTAERSFGR